MKKKVNTENNQTALKPLLAQPAVMRRSVLELRNKQHTFFDIANDDLAHLRQNEDDWIENWFEMYKEFNENEEEDMLRSLHDLIPYCLAQKMYEHGFDMNKYGYFSFA